MWQGRSSCCVHNRYLSWTSLPRRVFEERCQFFSATTLIFRPFSLHPERKPPGKCTFRWLACLYLGTERAALACARLVTFLAWTSRHTVTSEKREKYRSARSACVFLFISENERQCCALKRASELKKKYNLHLVLVDNGIFTSRYVPRCARLTSSIFDLPAARHICRLGQPCAPQAICALGEYEPISTRAWWILYTYFTFFLKLDSVVPSLFHRKGLEFS